jgi:hypothetical protein
LKIGAACEANVGFKDDTLTTSHSNVGSVAVEQLAKVVREHAHTSLSQKMWNLAMLLQSFLPRVGACQTKVEKEFP